jgi:hypothetical protein
VFAFRDPKGAILGFNVVFDGLFALPPGEKGHRFRAESWRAPDSKLWKSLTEDDIQLGEGDHTREGRVYETMRRDAFNLLVRKTSGVLYRASAP